MRGWSTTCTTGSWPIPTRSRRAGGSSSPTTDPPPSRAASRRRTPTLRLRRLRTDRQRPPPLSRRPPPRPRLPSAAAASEDPLLLRGAASRIVANMEASLSVPTATSVRSVPARLLEVNRLILNNQLARTTGAKVSFTHIIGYAVVRALHDVPALERRVRPRRQRLGQAGRHPPQARGLGPRGRPGEERRNAHAVGAVHQGGRHARLPLLRPRLRGADPQDPHQQDRPGRLRRDDGVAHQPRHARHRAVGAAPHAGPGRHHRRRRARLPARLRGGRPPRPGRTSASARSSR